MKRLFALTLLYLLPACSSPQIEDYAGETPTLDIRSYMNGQLTAKGIIKDFTGEVTSSFVVDIDASWDGDVGTLDEHFTFNDGTTDRRVWTITFENYHYFTGQADDVIGEARGAQFGNSLNMQYVLRAERGDGTIDLHMDDWMHLIDEKTLINHTIMSKFGVKVGEVLIAFEKE